MSDNEHGGGDVFGGDEEIRRSGKRGKDQREGKPLPVTPEPTNKELCDWMMELFDGEFPSKLELFEIHGKTGPLAEGTRHDHYNFSPKQEVPSREFFVKLSNRFLAAAQRDCDMRRRPQNYIVKAFNDAKDADRYSSFPLPLSPKALYLKSLNNKPININGDNDDDDTEGHDRFAGDKLHRRVAELFTEAKQNREMVYAAMGQMFKLYAETNTDLREENDKLRQRWQDATEQAEKAKSEQATRDLDIRKQSFWLDQMKDGAHWIKGMLPPVVNAMAKKQIMQDTQPPEQMVFANLIQSCSDEQIEDAFGKWNSTDPDNPKVVNEPLFTVRQTFIINAIADGKIDPSRGICLDNLVRGPDRITPDQIAKAPTVFRESQMQPVQNLIFMFMKQIAKEKS